MQLTFCRDKKLTKPGYDKVFSQGKSYRIPGFVVLVCPNQSNSARIGIIVAKKNIKKASDRNRVKRVIREAFRLGQAELKGWDIVVLARYNAGEQKSLNTRQQLEKVWKKLARSQKPVACV